MQTQSDTSSSRPFPGLAFAAGFGSPPPLAPTMAYLAATPVLLEPAALRGSVAALFLLALGAMLIAVLALARLRRVRARLTSLAEQRRAEQAAQCRTQTLLHIAQASFTNLVNLSEDALIAVDGSQRIRLFNAAAERMFGYPAATVLGHPLDLLLPARLHAAHQRHVAGFVAGAATLRPMQERGVLVGRRQDGSEFPLEATLSKLEVEGQHVLTARVRDVTAERQAHRVAQELAAIVASSDDAIIGRTVTGIITSWNAGAERLYGYRATEAIGQPMRLIVPEEQQAELANLAARVLRGESVSHLETLRRHKDGAHRYVAVSASPIRTPQGEIIGVATIGRDITEQKRLEAHRRQAQKLEAIGTLAGGIAHDFNNILGVIIGNAEIATDVAPSPPLQDALTEILRASERARVLIRQMLAFSRPIDQPRQPVRLQPVVTEALRFLRASLPSTIHIREHLEPDPITVAADPTQLHQVLLNLGTNAGHAMRERGGVLEVHLKAVEVDREFAANHPPMRPGPHAKLMVRDTGHGMPPEIQERIFDPFFTTKRPGEGTGMGLAVVHGIVAGHGGTILVESAPARGTRFDIYLPRTDAAPAPPPAGPAPTDILGQHEHILLVDDEPALIRVWRVLLEQSGYRVTATTDSREALELFRDAPDTFDLVITDQTMPGMTGEVLAEHLGRLRPDLPVILCTGSAATAAAATARPSVRAVLLKPIGRRDLCLTVRRLLGQRMATA